MCKICGPTPVLDLRSASGRTRQDIEPYFDNVVPVAEAKRQS